MSKAEFAHALGWAPSTVSKWESGRARPSRLGLKIILAFGEERGVRYRPHRLALPVVSAPPATARAVEVMPVPARHVPEASAVTPGVDRPRWEAVVNFRLSVDRRSADPLERRRRWLGNLTLASAVCAVLLLVVTVLTTSSSSIPTLERHPVARMNRRIERTPKEASTVAPAAEAEIESAPVDADHADDAPPFAAAAPAAPEPRSLTTRLEGVTLLGSVRTATFRTNADTLTISEGSQLGDRQVVRIHGQGVDLSGPAGALQTVRLGETVAVQ